MRLGPTWLAVVATCAAAATAQQLATCDSAITGPIYYSADGLSCEALTEYAVTPPTAVPAADKLATVCANSACTKFFTALGVAVPSDCLEGALKLRSELLEQLPSLCAPYRGSTVNDTNSSNTTAPTPTPTATTSSSGSSTTMRVLTIIGYVISGLVALYVLFIAFGCLILLVECLKSTLYSIIGCCCCCFLSSEPEKDELVDDYHVDHMEYEDIERGEPPANSKEATASAVTSRTQSTTATTTTSRSTGPVATSSTLRTTSSGSDAAVRTLIEDTAIQQASIHLEDLHVGSVINHGAYGEVLRGFYDSEPVAIKRLLPARRQDMKEIAAFLEEAKLMTTLRHANIVRLIGVAWDWQADSLQDATRDLSIVCELLEGGDLRSMLSHADTNNAPTGFHSDNLQIAIDVASALTYMHGLPQAIVHRDLKSKNVLLTRDLHAKLTDFGISRERADATMTAGVGSFLWMAPEIVFGRRYDEKADVFSFGVLLSELDTHELPYAHAVEHGSDRKLTEMMIVKMVSEGSLTVGFSETADAEVVELARACVATSAVLRPSAETVLRRLGEIAERMAQTKVSSLEDTNAYSLTTTRRMY